MNVNLIPAVNGVLELSEEKSFVFPHRYAMDGTYAAADEVFSERMAKLGNYCADEAARKAVTLEITPALSEEAYELSIGTEDIRVCAAGEKGYAYALVTLYQLLASNAAFTARARPKHTTFSSNYSMS